MSFHDPYFDIPAISNSMLGDIDVSIANWRYKKNNPLIEGTYDENNPNNPTGATILGSALHESVLEPIRYAQRVALGEYEKSKDVGAGYMKTAYIKGKELLLRGQAEIVSNMRKALEEHPEGRDIFSEAKKELSVLFEYNGMQCKSKIDWFNKDRKLIRDLKTIAKIGDVEKSINNGYFRQASFYKLAILQKYGILCDFEFIFVSKENVKEVKVVRMHNDWYSLGIDEIDRLMKKYKDWETGYETFEGAFKEVVTSYPPEWIKRKILGGDYDNTI